MERKAYTHIILPNFCVKDEHLFFILEDTLMQIDILQKDDLIVEMEDELVRVEYEWFLYEDPRGLRCRIEWMDGSSFYQQDIQILGKIIEMNMMGMNLKKTYRLNDFSEELKKKKLKKIVSREETESD